ncbi:putative GTP-binding protein YjiA [Planctomycetes bacterium Poly30]|uniref:Putative GTP-binding protein YjiA n=1 Tax=Saltatorellus ferox TaxID=2528018 RepID=A0A518EQL8_9BACT|nr:putative GTP-binding protein YjiA [Planctomycetes bacterium Poly30]
MTVPVTLIAGFLGSGKTTLVRRILAGSHGVRCAVIVNEFGEVGIDGDLLQRANVKRADSQGGGAVVELANGCICCEIQDDLRTTLLGLVPEDPARAPFDRVLVEASGAASPGPAAQTFLIDGVLQARVHLDGIVALVHAGLIDHLLRETAEAEAQIAYADRIVLNHADRVEAEEAERVAGLMRSLNPLADVRTAVRAEVPLDWVLGQKGAVEREPPGPRVTRAADREVARHTKGLGSVSLVAKGAVDVDALVIWLEFLAKRRSHELMRAKGVVAARSRQGGQQGVPPRCLEIQGVYRWLEVTDGEGEAPERSQLVLIGRDLDEAEIRRGWAAITGAG